jgi:sugar phosphate isomerase/epimerase
MPRFSANLGFLWLDRPLLERIDAASAAGFKAIELHWPYSTTAKEVRERCDRHGLVLLGINTPVGNAEKGDFGLGAQAGREAEFRETLPMPPTMRALPARPPYTSWPASWRGRTETARNWCSSRNCVSLRLPPRT